MSETYSLAIAPAAQRQIKKLDAAARKRISQAIDALKNTPRPPGVKKLADMPGLYRIRTGDYRIIYTIKDRQLLIIVVGVGRRDGIYKSLE